MYLRYFGLLKPKHHFLVHYGLLLKLLVPLFWLSALKCERFHRRGSIYGKVCNSKVDFPFSVAVKYQLYLCERLMRSENDRRPCKMTFARNLHSYSLEFYHSFAKIIPFNGNDVVTDVKSLEVFGTTYAKNMVLVVRVDELLPVFGKIVHILVNENSVLFVINVLKNLFYRENTCAYGVSISNEWVCLRHSDLFYYLPLWQRTCATYGTKMVSVQHML